MTTIAANSQGRAIIQIANRQHKSRRTAYVEGRLVGVELRVIGQDGKGNLLACAAVANLAAHRIERVRVLERRNGQGVARPGCAHGERHSTGRVRCGSRVQLRARNHVAAFKALG